MMSLFIGLTLCVSLWHLMLQQQQQEQFIEPPPPVVALTNESNIPPFILSPSTEISNSHHDMQLELLPKNDLSQLIDLDEFEFLMSPKTCRELAHQPLIVILVHSAPDNMLKRKTIRETWGSEDERAVLIFLIGAVSSTHLQEKIDLENLVHRDLVQGNFKDAYRNMTYKHVMALKWFVYNCPDARYLLKTDDDVFVNTPLMYNYLESPSPLHQKFQQGRLMFCYEIARAKVKRTFRSKWRVSYDEYMASYYPNHCPGFSILYSADVVLQLYQKAQKLPYFWIDDVHITGIVASQLNISITPLESFFLRVEEQEALLSGRSKPADLPFFFARPNLVEVDIRNLWKLVKSAVTSTSLPHDNLNDNEVGE